MFYGIANIRQLAGMGLRPEHGGEIARVHSIEHTDGFGDRVGHVVHRFPPLAARNSQSSSSMPSICFSRW